MADESQNVGYRVDLLVNGTPSIPHRLSRTHTKYEADRTTLTGSAILTLRANTVLNLKVTVEGLRRKKYVVPEKGARMSVKLLRRF